MRIAKLLLPSIVAIASINVAVAQPNVAASIKPIHSLVSSVMEGVAHHFCWSRQAHHIPIHLSQVRRDICKRQMQSFGLHMM